MPAGTAGFCIDATEVTNAQYAAFLAAPPSSPLTGACVGHNTYQPTNWPYPNGAGDLPVVGVDWCDAYVYCEWAGQRLCGRIGGGSNPTGAATEATQSQWYSACSADGTLAYPYGATYQAGLCNGDKPQGSPLVAVGSDTGCVGGYPGIFDMSGNVWEWEDSCSAATGPGDICLVRGGGVNQDQTGLGCMVNPTALRGTAANDRGLRCCGP